MTPLDFLMGFLPVITFFLAIIVVRVCFLEQNKVSETPKVACCNHSEDIKNEVCFFSHEDNRIVWGSGGSLLTKTASLELETEMYPGGPWSATSKVFPGQRYRLKAIKTQSFNQRFF